MRVSPSLSALPIFLSMLGLQACAGSAAAPAHAANGDAGDAGSEAGIDSGFGSTGPCFWGQGEGADAAACLVGADCLAGQVCVVAEGCFCTSNGRCFDDPCDGGLSSSCQGLCAYSGSPSSVDVDARAAYCLVEGC